MIKIHPQIEQKFTCPVCGQELEAKKTVWQGIHVCAETMCEDCHRTFYQDLKVGQSMYSPYSVDLQNFELAGQEGSKGWYGTPFQKSIENPDIGPIELKIETYKNCDKVIILNCIDYLYGHSLLKLLNAERHLKNNPEYGLIIIAPKFLEWMLPKGIAEKWIVDIPLKHGQHFFVALNEAIQKELKRYSEVYVSKAYSHPNDFNITNFTDIEKHDFQRSDFRITFIWREDRLWINNILLNKVINKINFSILNSIFTTWQKIKIVKVFSKIKKIHPNATFTVTGFGKYKRFPKWIDYQIVNNFSATKEKELCQIYADSRIVIGVHGSNMLLPSAHAGMTLDLMPSDRWGNIAQDVLYQEFDVKMSSYRYRYIPISQSTNCIRKLIKHMLLHREGYVKYMILHDK